MKRWTAAWSSERAVRVSVLVAVLVVCLIVVQCGGGTPQGPTPPPSSTTPPGDPGPGPNPSPSGPVTFVGAGDIAQCNGPDSPAFATGRLVASLGGTVFTLGDNAYDHGTAKEFRDCYDAAWGGVRSYTRPALGNHEYEGGADPMNYFNYFGMNAGEKAFPAGGYYSHELGEWHAIVLNSNIAMTESSPQGVFLKGDLALHRNKCTIAYWHHPLFTSGQNGPQPISREFWSLLRQAGVDVILNGHDHLYERFAPQDENGVPEPLKGIRQFTVGTGGANPLYEFTTQAANSEKKIRAFGVLKLVLRTDAYDWQFIQTNGATTDSGSGVCH